MRPPAESNFDSAHAVFAQRQHVGRKTRESTRETSKNLKNPPKINLKSTKIAPRDPRRATSGEKSRSKKARSGSSSDPGAIRAASVATGVAPGSIGGGSARSLSQRGFVACVHSRKVASCLAFTLAKWLCGLTYVSQSGFVACVQIGRESCRVRL